MLYHTPFFRILRPTLITCLVFLVMLPLQAARPLVRTPYLVTQPNGEVLWIYRAGGEQITFFRTVDDVPILRNEGGDYCYARFLQDGTLLNTQVIAHEADQRNDAERTLADEARTSMESIASMVQLRPSTHLHTAATQATATLRALGTPTIPVLLVAFSDRDFYSTNDIPAFTRHLNASGYNEVGNYGSVRDYFADQSDSLFLPRFDVAAKVTLPHPTAYYGKNGTNGQIDMRSMEMAQQAIALAAQQGVNFATYATEGKVPLVAIIYAGEGEQQKAAGHGDDLLRAKYSSLVSTTVNDVKIVSYLCTNEVLRTAISAGSKDSVDVRDGIGVFCHELGHALGLPDFYDTTTGKSFGMDIWSIMDYGEYVLNGYRPMGYSAYERAYMGWIKIPTLTKAQDYILNPLHLAHGNRAYKIVNPADENEYYIMENRQPAKWFLKNLSGGMLVTHIVYDANAWALNRVNTLPQKQRMSPVQADNLAQSINEVLSGKVSFQSLQNDLFPGTDGAIKDFTSTTMPTMSFYTQTTVQMPMYNISRKGNDIHFSFIDNNLVSNISSVLTNQVQPLMPCTVYTINGQRLMTAPSWSIAQTVLTTGTYIIQQQGRTFKVCLP